MCQLFTGRTQHTPSTLALPSHSLAVLALGLVSIQSSRTCVSLALCVAHVWQLHTLCPYYEFVLLHCFPLLSWAKIGLPCPEGHKGNVLQHTQSVISFLLFALNEGLPFQHLPSATRLALLYSTVGNTTAPACFPCAPVCLLNVISNVYSLQGRRRLILAHG